MSLDTESERSDEYYIYLVFLVLLIVILILLVAIILKKINIYIKQRKKNKIIYFDKTSEESSDQESNDEYDEYIKYTPKRTSKLYKPININMEEIILNEVENKNNKNSDKIN